MLARHVHDLLALSRRQASPDVPRGQGNTDGPKASREARSHGAYPRTGTTRRAPCRGPSPCRCRCRCRCHDPSRPRAVGTLRPTSSSSLSLSLSSSPRARPAALARGAYPFAYPSRAPSLSPCPCRREGAAGGSGRAARREPRRCRWPACASRLAAPAVGSAGARASGRASGSTLACAQDSNPDRTPEEPPRGRRARSNVCPRVAPREPGAAARTPLGARNAEGMTAVP
jgi:hypothetical protein